MIQAEADSKDLERRNKILSDSITIYQSSQPSSAHESLQQSAKSSLPSSSSSSIPILPSLSDSILPINTLSRLINYFLNIVDKENTSSVAQPPSRAPTSVTTTCSTTSVTSPPTCTELPDIQLSTNSHEIPTILSNSLPSYPVQQVEQTVDVVDVSEEVTVVNCSMDTIDEFTDNILLNENSRLENLNCQPLTIQ